MPDPVSGITAAVSLGSAALKSGASNSATRAQTQADAMAIQEQQRQFDALRNLAAPYVQAGNQGLDSLLPLTGVLGYDRQQQAVGNIQNAPLFQSLVAQGEQGILQNASATGGLRGGNTQGALAQFGPQMLNQQIQQQLAQFGGLASLGQNAASGVGNAGMQLGQQIGAIRQNTGQANAYNALNQGSAWNGALSGLGGQLGGMFGGGGFGGGMPNVGQIMAGANASLGAGSPGMVRF